MLTVVLNLLKFTFIFQKIALLKALNKFGTTLLWIFKLVVLEKCKYIFEVLNTLSAVLKITKFTDKVYGDKF